MISIIENIKARGEEMSVLEGQERLHYLIDLARQKGPLADKHKIEKNKIRGCASNLWVISNKNIHDKMYYDYEAEAYITKGTAKLVIDLVQHQPAEEIAKLKLENFTALGIKELLTPQRQNGLGKLIDRIIGLAKQ